ncbi:MAG: hypothetical protein ACI8UD_000007 [Planctomycetota bacterium]|jgi:hypothetical protein
MRLATLVPLLLTLAAALPGTATAASQSPQLAFFENRIRPVLAEHCYRCHNSSGTKKARLALDYRAGLRRGGASGPAMVVGNAAESLLIRAIRHQHPKLRMPKEGPKLSDAVVQDFEHWIDSGAADPRDEPPAATKLAATLNWDAMLRRRQQWWSFQPIASTKPPALTSVGQSPHPVDRFVVDSLRRAGLELAPRADRRTLLRRVTFALTGLPPTATEVMAFVADDSDNAYETVVDRLLNRPAFGERWARHWMDWLRYADSHGSEGDPNIPHAWRYRDYLIRALNADVPFDRLVKEHLAGDLLAEPRIDRERGINQSRIGTAQFRMVQHGYAPTDALEEQVRFTDNQIDVVFKAFMGLTVSCARCHDHKFDAIGQDDFYAIYGIFASCRPAMVTIDTPARLATNKTELVASKGRIQKGLAKAWLATTEHVINRLLAPDAVMQGLLDKASEDDKNPLHAWARLAPVKPATFAGDWRQLVHTWRESRVRRNRLQANAVGWDLGGEDYAKWYPYGAGLTGKPTPAGGFRVLPDGDRVIDTLLPAGVYSHLLSSKHNGVLTSPRFSFDMKEIYVRVVGDGGARARYVVQNYPRGGTVYPIHHMDDGKSRWVRWDTSYWHGDHGYLELSTAADQAVEANTGATRSWFGITQAIMVSAEQQQRGERPVDEAADFVTPLFLALAETPPTSMAMLARGYAESLRTCIRAWQRATLSNEQARFLGFFVRDGLLPVTLRELEPLADEVANYRHLEEQVPIPRRAPGILETEPFDQPLFHKGDHKQPGKPVRRRFLAAIDESPYETTNSGRLDLANDFVRADNPLTARVAVNRLWHHLFGRGIVATTDNFGRLGDQPTHPELLDYLAKTLVDSGWSSKQMIRLLVTSQTFQANSSASNRATEVDPANRLGSHFRVQRLQAEAVRDAIIAVSGQIDRSMYGPAVAGDSRRRSVYVGVKRNSLDPFLSTFDAPAPHTTHGRRESTNVPAQSLTLLNDPFVIAQARNWADAILSDRSLHDDTARIQRMFLTAFGREASISEQQRCADFLTAITSQAATTAREFTRLQTEVSGARRQQAALMAPTQKRLLASIEQHAEAKPDGPKPIANWEFDGDLKDSIGSLHGQMRGKVQLQDGALVLTGQGHVETARLTRDLREKTLEAWVVLDNLEQRGGGVISVESVGGNVFDAIVFGERDAMQWLSGSDNFHRTQSLGGAVESDAKRRAVHVAISYSRDGTITAYRDGRRYGKPYQSSPATFDAGQSVVLFGLRHSPANGGKYLHGRLLRARLYGRALTQIEVEASFRKERQWLGDAQVLAAMTTSQRNQHARIGARIEELARQIAKIDDPRQRDEGPQRAWQDLAQSLFNFKEFLYVR